MLKPRVRKFFLGVGGGGGCKGDAIFENDALAACRRAVYFYTGDHAKIPSFFL